jgi:long-chain acyl-CoA synthetase
VIVGIPDIKRPGNDIVTLYEKPAESSCPAVEAQINAFCEAEMAAYKLPRVVHFLDEVPLTSVGKIDKKVLRVEASRLAEAHSAK